MLLKHSIILLLGLAQSGCDQLDTSKSLPANAAVDRMLAASRAGKQCTAENRFKQTEVYPVTMRADIALDSCTGQLCRTWNWSPRVANNPWGVYADLPLCLDLPNAKP